jgi:hypothetical protein
MMEFVRDLWGFLRTKKRWWLLPALLALFVIGGLIVLSTGSAIAPFIYTIF